MRRIPPACVARARPDRSLRRGAHTGTASAADGTPSPPWNDAFVASLERTSGKGRAADAAVNSAKDILSAALDSHGVQEVKKKGLKAVAAAKEGAGSPSPSPSPGKKTPTEEVLEEINKIKDRLSLLPIKSSGALYGPGEGVMKVYEQLKDAEERKKADDLKKPATLRRVPVTPGGMAIPAALTSPEAIARRREQHRACTA